VGAGTRKQWIGINEPIPHKPAEKYPFRIMVFGDISWWGKSRLVRMPAGHHITAADYLDTIKNITLPEVHELFRGDPDNSDNDARGGGTGFEWVQGSIARQLTTRIRSGLKCEMYDLFGCAFDAHATPLQDNASVHTARIVTEWLDEQRFDVLTPWPANSPDLNPIENVWGIMVQRLAGRTFSSAESFWRAIVKEWDAISYRTLRSLYASFPARYEAVIEAAGHPTRY